MRKVDAGYKKISYLTVQRFLQSIWKFCDKEQYTSQGVVKLSGKIVTSRWMKVIIQSGSSHTKYQLHTYSFSEAFYSKTELSFKVNV